MSNDGLRVLFFTVDTLQIYSNISSYSLWVGTENILRIVQVFNLIKSSPWSSSTHCEKGQIGDP